MQQGASGQPNQAGGQRTVCDKCGANNFIGQPQCWQCRAALPGAASGIKPTTAPVFSTMPHANHGHQPAIAAYPPVPANAAQSVSRTNFPLVFGGIAAVTFVLVLMFAMHTHPEAVRTPAVSMPVRSADSTGSIDSTPESTNASKSTPVDPVDEQARRVIQTESPKIGIPPSVSVSPDGRVHLRSGGTISKEEWDNARRKAQESSVMQDSAPPTPPL